MFRILFTFISFLVFIALLVLPFLGEQEQVVKTESKQPSLTAKKETPPPVKPAVTALPDFSQYRDVKKKKKEFFGFLRAQVDFVNQQIAIEREFIERFENRPQFAKDIERFNRIAKRFKVDVEQPFDTVKSQLLLKVDGLPVELVLMQAANESAWATSRFAVKANNLFGQWCFKKGCGLVPEGRPAGKTYEVRKFDTPLDSVKSYFHNLNTGWAYEDLRNIRAQQRAANQELDASTLAEGLIAYSTRREEYVKEIQNMIRINKKFISYE